MDLTFYAHQGWHPRIRPASPKRDWMEDTPERFAYRCLPLAIANAHGWEILSPCGFEARWNGGKDTSAVEIRLDPGSEPHQPPVSLFGHGTLTFHIEALIRTPPGWNLWVGGSPNAAKDGIAPLSGVIETDWSPYSFTMNWRFTRPDHWIRFEGNEPFCFVFPLQRGVIEDVEPQIRPIEEAPELLAAFTKWSASRDAFHARVKTEQPSAPADKWQKLYYRGIDPEGRSGVSDHEAKLRPAAVRQFGPDGQEQFQQCPVAANTPVPGPHADEPEPFTPALLSDGMMSLTLNHIGFDPRPRRVPAKVAQTPPFAPETTLEPETPSADVVLRRREWLLAVGERQRSLSPRTGGIERVRDLSADDFLDHHYAPGRPVVIEGAIADWPALERWTPAYLGEIVGGAQIEFQGERGTSPNFELYKDKHRMVMPFDRFIEMITDDCSNDAYITAYNSSRNGEALAPLRADLGTLDRYLTDAPGMMWIGPLGTFTPLHFDLTNNLLAQIVGSKRVILLPPSETAKLYHRRHVFSDVHDVTDPDRLDRYPLAADARSFEVDLGPGDLLYIPVGWWHQVTSLDFSVMLTYTNFRWPNDAYATFPADAAS